MPTETPARHRFLDDEALARRILDHLDGGTTDLAAASWREPVANYTSPERLAAEVAMLRRLPVPFCPSAALDRPGAYVARDAAGVPILAVRGQDGEVRAFRNSCRHRGAMLAEGSGCVPSFMCQYHGWVYRLDGDLRHVPGEHGFPGLDRERRGLVPVAAVEHGGLVLVAQDAALDADVVARDLPTLLGGDEELLVATDLVMEANWKVLVEGFLEGYHLKTTHRETFFPFGYDNLTVVEAAGRHTRVTFPFRRIEALRDLPPEQWSLDGRVTLVHHLFPNVIVARLSHHTTMVVLEPLASDRTRFVTYLLSEPRRGHRSGDDAARDVDFVRQGAEEDRRMACAVQRGLESGANEVVEFGLFEGALSDFHRHLHEELGE